MKVMQILIAAWLPALSMAASSPFEGEWAITAQGRTIVLVEIDAGEAPAQLGGSLSRPTRLDVSPRLAFTNIGGPAHTSPMRNIAVEDDTLRFSTASPSNPDMLTQFEMKIESANTAHLSFVGGPPVPFILTRAEPGARVPDRWDEGLSLAMDIHATPNQELRQLHDADQRERATYPDIDWRTLQVADARRRQRVRQMIANNELAAGADFYHAAMIFQHGDSSNDYLLAHSLSMIAMARGYANAAWLSAATLDRYLVSIERPQIFGSQFGEKEIAFDSTLISDDLRRHLGVPTLAEREIQRRKFAEMDEKEGSAR